MLSSSIQLDVRLYLGLHRASGVAGVDVETRSAWFPTLRVAGQSQPTRYKVCKNQPIVLALLHQNLSPILVFL